jgi:hypothetical protein
MVENRACFSQLLNSLGFFALVNFFRTLINDDAEQSKLNPGGGNKPKEIETEKKAINRTM